MCLALAVSCYGQKSDFYVKLGNEKWASHDYAGADADFSKAIELDARNAEAWHGRGTAKYAQDDYPGGYPGLLGGDSEMAGEDIAGGVAIGLGIVAIVAGGIVRHAAIGIVEHGIFGAVARYHAGAGIGFGAGSREECNHQDKCERE